MAIIWATTWLEPETIEGANLLVPDFFYLIWFFDIIIMWVFMPCLRIVLNIHERGHWGVKLILHCWVSSWFCKIKLYFICLYQLKFWESYLKFLKAFNFIFYQGLACLGRKNIYDFLYIILIIIYIKKAS